MNLNDITVKEFINTEKLENALAQHIVNEKNSKKGLLSYIDTNLFVKNFMNNYEKYFRRSINICYLVTRDDILSSTTMNWLDDNKNDSSLETKADKEDQNAKQ